MQDKTILVVDDVVNNLDVLVELLDDYDVVEATNGTDALEIINQERIDLILLDIVMPDMSGFEVCEILKSNDKTKNIPIIFITAKTDEDSIVKAYDIGGIDYITKPFKSRELLARVNRELKIQNLIHELEVSKEELRVLASQDPLTKLYNRRYLSKASSHILSLVKRDKTDLSIIMLDIDNFKMINDKYGHKTGDDVLVVLASKLQDTRRGSDIVCRFGGEEFLILFPQIQIDKAFSISEKLREDISNIVISTDNNQELKFTVSIGVSQLNHNEDVKIEDIIKKADDALYKAKDSGRNKVCKYNDT